MMMMMMIMSSGIWISLHTGRNVSAVWRNILPPPSTLKTEAAGSTRQYDFTAKNALITAITLIQICCNRRAITCPSQPITVQGHEFYMYVLLQYNDAQYNQHKSLSPNEAWTVTGSVCAFTVVCNLCFHSWKIMHCIVHCQKTRIVQICSSCKISCYFAHQPSTQATEYCVVASNIFSIIAEMHFSSHALGTKHQTAVWFRRSLKN